MATKITEIIQLNPKGKLIGEIYRSRLSKQWRWRTKSFQNGKKTANGGEDFKRIAGAQKGLMLHCGNLRMIRIYGK